MARMGLRVQAQVLLLRLRSLGTFYVKCVSFAEASGTFEKNKKYDPP